MIAPAGLPRGIGRLDRGSTALSSGFGSTRNRHEDIHENAFETSFASDSSQTEYFYNPYCPREFLIDRSSSLGARMIWDKIPINKAIISIE